MTHVFDKNLTPYHYVVVKLLDKPVGVLDNYVCVPDFWVETIGSTDWIVSVAYPVEDQVITVYRAKRPEKPRKDWKHYQAIIVEHKLNSYIDPKIWIAKYQATVENKRPAEKGYQSLSALEGMVRSYGDFPSSLKTLQTVVTPSKPSQKPMIRVAPVVRNRPESTASGADINENRSQIAMAVELTKQSLLEHIDLKIPAVQSSSNLTINSSQQLKCPVQKQFAPVIQNFPQEVPGTPELRRHIPVCVENLYRKTQEIAAERSNNVQINMAFTAPTIKKPSNKANQSLLQQIAEYIATQFFQTANDRNTKQNHIENASATQSRAEETKSTKRHVRKPKYNPNKSKWTLKYRKRERGLEELVPDTGVYVNAIELAHCKRSSDNCNTLARMLLTEVFSHKALTSCSLNVTRSNGNKITHELDEFAIKVILKFVEDYGSEKQWDKFDYKSVTQSMHYEIRRAKNGK